MEAHQPSVSQIQQPVKVHGRYTTSREPQPGGLESRGGVTLVNTNNTAAESEADKYNSTSTLVVVMALTYVTKLRQSYLQQDLDYLA